jgi:putative transposase
MPRRNQLAIPDELSDRFLAGSDPRAGLADGGLLDGLKKVLTEPALGKRRGGGTLRHVVAL